MTDHRLRVLSGSPEQAATLRKVLDDTTIRVVLEGDSPPLAHQIMAVTVVDLLGRLFPRLDIVVSPRATVVPGMPPGPALLGDRLQAARGHGGLTPAPVGVAAFTIAIGAGESSADVVIDGDGWQSYIGTTPSQLGIPRSAVPFGPLAAAARAVAHAQAFALRDFITPHAIPEGVYSTLLGYRTSSTPLPASDVLPGPLDAVLVGAGSIGGAAIYALSYAPGLSGRLVVIDPQGLEERNPVRALLARHDDAVAGARKIDVAAATLAHHGCLRVVGFDGRVDAYHATLARTDVLPLVLCAVDSSESRRDVQDCLPWEVINAACHPANIVVSRHITDNGPCVCCLHMGDVLDASRTRTNMIARDTGLPAFAKTGISVAQLLTTGQPLDATIVRSIERVRGVPARALAMYEGRSLGELWESALLYAETSVQSSDACITVASACTTALAGFVLAAEAVKPVGVPALCLGPGGCATKYQEDPFTTPGFPLLTTCDRWPTSECVCRSTRRLRLMHERYGVVNRAAQSA